VQTKNCAANADLSFTPGKTMSIRLRQTADEAIGPFSNGPKHEPVAVAFPKMETRQTSSVIEPLPQPPMLAKWQSGRIAIKAKGRILVIDAADAIAVEGKGIYVLLRHASSSHMLRASMATMEEKLNPHGFVRIHRSVLVNAALVEEIRPTRAGEYVLRLKGGKEYTVTRTYKKNLHLLAQSWIGTDRFAIG
jgi:DNA-binding LytR/AlgR family response regulator